MATSVIFCVRRLKLMSLTEQAGKDVLTFILKRGALNAPTTPPGICLNQYLDQLSATSSANYVKMTRRQKNGALTRSDLRHIENSPMWDNFDVTLLHKAIRLTCEGVAGINDPNWHDPNMLEGLVTRIRDERNGIFREISVLSEEDYLTRVRELEDLLYETLNAAKMRYQIPDMEMKPVKDKLQHLIDSHRNGEIEKEIITSSFYSRQKEFMNICQNNFKNMYEKMQTFDPLSFLTCSPQHLVHIQNIFCKMTLLEGRGSYQQRQIIDACDILTVTRPTEQEPQPSTSSSDTQHYRRPQLIMVRGLPGSGKTTLLTYLLSEWLKDPEDCSVKHLHEFDNVMYIDCNKKEFPSIMDILKQHLPNDLAKMEEYLMNYLLAGRVLFLLDDVNRTLPPGNQSYLYAYNILNATKYAANVTHICTARPEIADDLVISAPSYYDVRITEMTSVSPEQRTPFVLKHYASLPDNGNKDPEKLEYLMDFLGCNDFFGLPLNLVFLANLFHMNPNNIKVNTTQTSLYATIHDWCIQKLQARLADHPMHKETRAKVISLVLDSIYDMSLQSLLEGEIGLLGKNEQHLRMLCLNNGLPSVDVIPAFLNLYDNYELFNHISKYVAPHQSIQDFYAASGIVKKVKNGSSSRSIRHLLHNPKHSQIGKLRNLLRHIIGLLCHPSQKPLCTPAIQEAVGLLAETGIKDCNDWLSVLEDTEGNQTVLAYVERFIECNEEVVKITDNTINSAKALLPKIPSKEIWIDLCRKESDLQELIFEHHKYTELSLKHQYEHPDETNFCDSLLCITTRSCLRLFTGHLGTAGTQLLQECQNLEGLHLAVCDQDAQGVFSVIRTIHSLLPKLGSLVLHVPVQAMSTDKCTTPLPDGLQVSLVLSGADETLLEKAAKIAQALQPTAVGWRTIMFPRSDMTADVWKCLLEKLAAAGVTVWCGGEGMLDGGVIAPETNLITLEEERELCSLSRTLSLGCFSRKPEKLMWEM